MASKTLARIAEPSRLAAAAAPMGENAVVNANPTVLVIQHDLDTPPAALEPPLAALGVRTVTWQTLSQAEPPAGSFDGLLVLGGVVNPDGTDGDAPLEREREVIAGAHERGLPVLGICLGAQLVAQALDGSAQRMPKGEVGWVRIDFDEAAQSDALLAGAPASLDVNEWHNYSCTPPAGAVLLARNAACVQAFRVGATTWGLQFHVEVTRAVLEEWCETGASELAALGLADEVILGTDEQLTGQLRLAARIGDRFGRAVLAATIAA
jgi:GMP synthase (glutamine-hydrolysing)